VCGGEYKCFRRLKGNNPAKDSLTAEDVLYLCSRAFFVYGLRVQNKNGLMRKYHFALRLEQGLWVQNLHFEWCK
jgi:hypothetical protein